MMRPISASGWVLTATCAALFADCHDANEPPPILSDLIVSGLQAAPAAAPTRPALVAGGPGDSVFYVSLPVGTASEDGIAVVTNLRTGQLVETAVLDGGFTPVALSGVAGDTVVVTGSVQRTTIVPASRPPVVVRSEPPKKKTDVPLNASLLVYFSEPVDGGSVAPPAIQLFQGTTAVTGSVRFADSAHVSVQFVPTAPLIAGTDYRIVVSTQVHGEDGAALFASDTVPFTTGTTTTGQPASITMTINGVSIVGPSYQMTAIVRDSTGNILTDQPIEWSTTNPLGLTVSAGGMLLALAQGQYGVSATLGALSAVNDSVLVVGGPVASVILSPSPGSVAAGGTMTVTATVRDSGGHLLNYPVVSWSDFNQTLATLTPSGGGPYGGYYGTATALVTGVTAGVDSIGATSGAVSTRVTLTVTPPNPISPSPVHRQQ